MNSSPPPAASEKKDAAVGYPLSPTPYWMFWFNLSASFALLVYLTLEVISILRAFVLSTLTKRRHTSRTESAKSQNAKRPIHPIDAETDALHAWFARPSFKCDNYTYVYPSFRTRLEMIFVMSIFAGFTKIAYLLIRLDRDPHNTAVKLRAIAKTIRTRAEASEKFRQVFAELIELLLTIEASSASSIAWFVRTWSSEMTSKGNEWYMQFGHRRINLTYVPQRLYEATMATYALFHSQGAGFEAYYMNGHWKETGRSVFGALTLVMLFAFDRCYPAASSELMRTAGSGVEQILLVGRGLEFQRFVGHVSSRGDKLSKDLMMWDITRNCCNDFVESSWSVSCLERVVWTLEFGLGHVSMELYDRVKGQDGQRRVDMTQLSGKGLMTLAVAGLVRVRGLGDGPYRMVGSEEAMIEVHGNVPSVTVGDLVELRVVERRGAGRFAVGRLPGCERRFKAVVVGDAIKFVASARSEEFRATVAQQVV